MSVHIIIPLLCFVLVFVRFYFVKIIHMLSHIN